MTDRITLAITTHARADALARVLAGVRAQTRTPDEVIVAGHVEGEIRATHRVEVHATGLVQGEVSAASCLWLEGGRVIGMVRVGQAGDLTTPADGRRPLSPAAEATRRVARTG